MTKLNESFTAIDFETANYQSNSACQLGIVVVSNGQIIMQQSWFIRPPTKIFTFSYLHGITYPMVKDQPTFGDIWPQVKPYVTGEIIAAHNADFDLGVLTATLAHHQLYVPEFYVIDSLAVARKTWPDLKNHKLSTVAAHLNIELNHHEAASDAKACAEIILHAGQENVEINRVINRSMPESMDLFGGDY
jgi:DNA polymerase-3 subunit epsilon